MQSEVRRSLPELLQQTSVEALVVRKQGLLLAYLILETESYCERTGAKQSLILDLAVEPKYWGTEIVKRLVSAAAKHSSSCGNRQMSAVVGAHNKRTYMQALHLGFHLHSLTLQVECDSEGLLKQDECSLPISLYQESREGKKDSPLGLPGTWRELRSWRVHHRQVES